MSGDTSAVLVGTLGEVFSIGGAGGVLGATY